MFWYSPVSHTTVGAAFWGLLCSSLWAGDVMVSGSGLELVSASVFPGDGPNTWCYWMGDVLLSVVLPGDVMVSGSGLELVSASVLPGDGPNTW